MLSFACSQYRPRVLDMHNTSATDHAWLYCKVHLLRLTAHKLQAVSECDLLLAGEGSKLSTRVNGCGAAWLIGATVQASRRRCVIHTSCRGQKVFVAPAIPGRRCSQLDRIVSASACWASEVKSVQNASGVRGSGFSQLSRDVRRVKFQALDTKRKPSPKFNL